MGGDGPRPPCPPPPGSAPVTVDQLTPKGLVEHEIQIWCISTVGSIRYGAFLHWDLADMVHLYIGVYKIWCICIHTACDIDGGLT